MFWAPTSVHLGTIPRFLLAKVEIMAIVVAVVVVVVVVVVVTVEVVVVVASVVGIA